MNAPVQNQSSLAAVTADGAPTPGTETRETSGMVLAAQAKAIVEARYVVALKRPRDIDVVRAKLIKECERPGFAQVAMYSKPVGGSKITGPSIRFAEAAIRCMTNIVTDTPAVYDDAEKRIVRVSVTDLEANVSYTQDVTVQKTVERKSKKDTDVVLSTRRNSSGQIVYVIEGTDDDIQNKQNALISKAIRTLALRIVPGDIIEECMTIVMETQKNKDAKDPDGEKYKLFDAFGAIGVTVDQIKEYLGNDATKLQPKELADLRGIYTAIKDGEATWRDAMEARGMAAPAGDGSQNSAATTLADRIKARGKVDPAPAATTAAPKEAAATAQAEPAAEDHPFGPASDAPAAASTGAAKPKRRI